MARDIWKDYFTFSAKERVAVIILLVLIVLFIVLPFFHWQSTDKPVLDQKLVQQLAQLNPNKNPAAGDTDTIVNNQKQEIQSSKNAEYQKVTLFNFNPNTLDAEGWKRLGVKDKTIHTILNYRNKGGYFKDADALEKIYGLSKEQAAQLKPFVQIASAKTEFVETNSKKNGPPANIYSPKTPDVPAKKITANIQSIDINTATVEQWKALPGIGDILGNRVVKFRTAIKGFTSIDQVKKTYGLSDSTFRAIRPYLTLNGSKE